MKYSNLLDFFPKVLNVNQGSQQLAKIPLSTQQVELGMQNDLSCTVPTLNKALKTGGVFIAESLEGFKNLCPRPPSYKAVEKPLFIHEAGPQCDQRLLNPIQRRECMLFEKHKMAAEQALKVATSDRTKLKNQLTSLKFKRGVVNVDSYDNEFSETYASGANERRRIGEQKEQIRLERKSNLANRASSIVTNGNLINPETVDDRVKLRQDYQRKGGQNHPFTFDETYNRLFVRRMAAPLRIARCQNLRNNDLAGKTYNFINHTLIENWPSHEVEHLKDAAMEHPSQNSLEGTRNLQGTSLSRRHYY